MGYADATEAEITVVTARFGAVFDRGLAAYLDHERDMRILGRGLELDALEVTIARDSPRVAILGEAALASSSIPRRLQEVRPGIGVVALLPGISEWRSRQLLASGIMACIMQEASWSEIAAAIRLAAEGKQMLVSTTLGGLPFGYGSHELTRREREVFQFLQAGWSNTQIASTLHISVETVRSHIQNANRKLGVTRR